MPARRAEPSHPIWAKFQNAALKGCNYSSSLAKTFTPFSEVPSTKCTRGFIPFQVMLEAQLRAASIESKIAPF